MRSTSRCAEPARFKAVRRRFELWRRTRQGRARIPERLWMSAEKLVATYGLCRTARTLRLDSNALKRRVESASLKGSPTGPMPRRKMRAPSTPAAKKFAQNQGMTFVELAGDRPIAVFFTGRRHAGENLAEVLRHRAEGLSVPIQMCDALSRNEPKGLETILANCNAHGRCRFVDMAESFPEECRFVLETLEEVYKNEALTRKRNLSPQERLRFHQTQSGRVMGKLKGWLHRQLRQRPAEPNSGLGQAIQYMLKHWRKLTWFPKTAGAPVDNNICERALNWQSSIVRTRCSARPHREATSATSSCA